ncbi:DUF3429 domain-containing protein [Rubritepida flocculans]|jgi:hypothetical protein|uniref:DUF3429 domain-containing protein n=1 Tax=Rubritepida flocculans TaxID=182403 RepID=UPI00041CB73C|nr:DUF3429 domain-containing protein [Rubritepida flocculans]
MDASSTRLAWLLGLAGLLPFAAAALAVHAAPETWTGFARGALIGYGAVILSFLGAVHWGFAWRPLPGEEAAGPPRLMLGVAPALAGWAALLLPEWPAVLLLAAGILVTAGVEQAAAARGWVPPGYMLLRWVLSAGASLCLLAALAA